MKPIELPCGKFTLVDDSDFESMQKIAWHALPKIGKRAGYVQASTKRINGKRGTIYLHRLVAGATKGQIVDHIDFDVLNNQRSNLRICTKQQNCSHSRISSTNTSGFKGVHYEKRSGKWIAKIHRFGKGKHIGYYSNAIDAAKAWDAYSMKLDGEFAATNL